MDTASATASSFSSANKRTRNSVEVGQYRKLTLTPRQQRSIRLQFASGEFIETENNPICEVALNRTAVGADSTVVYRIVLGRGKPVPKQTKLPDGEFFVIDVDWNNPFSYRGMYDPDPKETEAIKAKRAAYYKTLGPKWRDPNIAHEDLFHVLDPVPPAMGPELVHKRSGLKRPKPKNGLDHYMQGCMDYATPNYNGSYLWVSPEWKAAIESVEPRVHEFFKHEVIFSDGLLPRYIFRERQTPNPEKFALLEDRLVQEPFRVHGKRKPLSGRHWVRQGGFVWNFASRDLAIRLLPLLPSRMRFVPITLID
jgi:hypothetical protein